MIGNMIWIAIRANGSLDCERDAAKYLKLSVNDLRRFVDNGRITARRHPGRSRRIYLKADLDHYLESLEKEGAA